MPPPFEIKKPKLVRTFSIVFKHVFSMEYLYKRVHEWLIEEGYCSDSSGANGDKWIEKLYLERIDGKGAKQIWIWWRTSKMHNNKFFKFHFDVDYHVLNLTSQEIVIDGTKVKTNKGEVEMWITAKLELDPAGDWNNHFLLKNPYIQNFYLNRMYKRRIEQAEDMLIRDSSRLMGAVKQYFQLESWIPEYTGKPFHPPKGE
ncbi:hypothetical protein ACFL3V_04000 [Nanoarchaeota archaeon]